MLIPCHKTGAWNPWPSSNSNCEFPPSHSHVLLSFPCYVKEPFSHLPCYHAGLSCFPQREVFPSKPNPAYVCRRQVGREDAPQNDDGGKSGPGFHDLVPRQLPQC